MIMAFFYWFTNIIFGLIGMMCLISALVGGKSNEYQKKLLVTAVIFLLLSFIFFSVLIL